MKGFFTFLKIIVLILISLGIAMIVVWPLWKFATSAPVIYTWSILILLVALLIFLLIKKLLKKHEK